MSVLEFTFQYGQIYYTSARVRASSRARIYIPIWLDLLLQHTRQVIQIKSYLHSNMVRFIMEKYEQEKVTNYVFTFQYGQIYYKLEQNKLKYIVSFTFQYGQIYYDLQEYQTEQIL